jgi:hypothetical protein
LQNVHGDAGWLSAAVEKTWLFLVGMVLLRSMIRVKTLRSVSMPRDRRHVQKQHVFHVAAQHAALDAAPTATTSSGLMLPP